MQLDSKFTLPFLGAPFAPLRTYSQLVAALRWTPWWILLSQYTWKTPWEIDMSTKSITAGEPVGFELVASYCALKRGVRCGRLVLNALIIEIIYSSRLRRDAGFAGQDDNFF